MPTYHEELKEILELHHYSFQDIKQFIPDLQEFYPEKSQEEIQQDMKDACLKDMLSNQIIDTLAISQELEIDEEKVKEEWQKKKIK